MSKMTEYIMYRVYQLYALKTLATMSTTYLVAALATVYMYTMFNVVCNENNVIRVFNEYSIYKKYIVNSVQTVFRIY